MMMLGFVASALVRGVRFDRRSVGGVRFRSVLDLAVGGADLVRNQGKMQGRGDVRARHEPRDERTQQARQKASLHGATSPPLTLHRAESNTASRIPQGERLRNRAPSS